MDGLEEIVYTIHFKGIEGILIIGGSEYDRLVEFNMIKYLKAQTIGQLNIHKYEIETVLMLTQVVEGALDAVNVTDRLNIWFDLIEHSLEILIGIDLIFYT